MVIIKIIKKHDNNNNALCLYNSHDIFIALENTVVAHISAKYPRCMSG